MMLIRFSLFFFIFKIINGEKEEILKEKAKKIMDQYLYLDKSDWTDFGDMFNYDPRTASNYKHAKNHQTLINFDQENLCLKDIQQLEKCQQELNLIKKQFKCDKLLLITMQRIGNKIRNKIQNLINYHGPPNSYYNLVIHLDSTNFGNFITINNNNCSSIEKIDMFFDQLISTFYLNLPDQIQKEKIFNYVILLIVIFTFITILCCFIKGNNHTRVLIIFSFFIALCVIWEWFKLYKTELAKMNLHLNYHSNCLSQDEKGWFLIIAQYFNKRFLFSSRDSDNCDKYYQAVYIDPFLNVSPAMALSAAVSHFFLQPLALLGHFFGLFFKNLFLHIPELYFLPILIATLIIILAFMKFFFEYKAVNKLSSKNHNQKLLLELKYKQKRFNQWPLTRSLSAGNLVF